MRVQEIYAATVVEGCLEKCFVCGPTLLTCSCAGTISFDDFGL